MHVCVYERWSVSKGRRRSPNRGREKLALEYLKARRGGGGRGNEMGRVSAAEEQRGGAEGDGERGARETRENALGIQVLMTRHRVSARSSNEEGGRSNAPRWRWLKAGCLSSFHLCLVPPRLSRTSFRTDRGLEAPSSSPSTRDARTHRKTPQRELASLFLLQRFLDAF